MTPVADVNATLNKVNNVINILAIMLRLSQFLGCPSLFKVFPILFFSFNLFFSKQTQHREGVLMTVQTRVRGTFRPPQFSVNTHDHEIREACEKKRGGKYPDQNFFCHSLTLYHYSRLSSRESTFNFADFGW